MTKVDDDLTGLTILVVDDHALTRAMVQSILKGAGFYKIVGADNGEIAIRRLSENTIDLVICDWNMPNGSGIDVLRHMRATTETKDIPFIMLTAEAYRNNVREAIEAGVTDYVAKPFTADTLIEKIRSVLRRSGRNRKVTDKEMNVLLGRRDADG